MFARSDTKYTNKLWAWSIVGWEFGGIYIDFVGPSTTWFKKKKKGNIECESYGGDRKFWSFTKGPRENWHRPKKIGALDGEHGNQISNMWKIHMRTLTKENKIIVWGGGVFNFEPLGV